MSYAERRNWSDRFIPQIKQIVGPRLLTTAPLEADVRYATDLILLHINSKEIACRMRKGVGSKWPNDFTVRTSRPGWEKSEYEKILNGWAGWMFYGHAEENSDTISRWMLLDLDAFRANQKGKSRVAGIPQNNFDGTSFLAFNVNRFAAPCGRNPLIIDQFPQRKIVEQGVLWDDERLAV